MKVSELRIGNWIIEPESEDKSPFQVWGVYCEKNNDKINGCPISLFKPIPLTEEWLLKFSFKKELDNFYRKNGSHFIEVLFYDEGFQVTSQFVCLDHIKYVHQLQNLYHALTGEELTESRKI